MTDDVVNVDQAAIWNGEDGSHWAANAEWYDRVVAGYHRRLVEVAHVRPGERVLDIGCGNGQVALELARRAAPSEVVGIDLSAPMLEVARSLAERGSPALDNVRFVRGDAQVHPFEPQAYDVAVSRFGAMFFADPVAAFANLAAALRPGGRLVLVAWQGLRVNPWFVNLRDALAAGRTLPDPPPTAPSPFALADPARVRALLSDAGFDAIEISPVHEPMRFGRDADDALAHLRGMGLVRSLLADLGPPERAEAERRLEATVVAAQRPGGGGVQMGSAAWLIVARRRG